MKERKISDKLIRLSLTRFSTASEDTIAIRSNEDTTLFALSCHISRPISSERIRSPISYFPFDSRLCYKTDPKIGPLNTNEPLKPAGHGSLYHMYIFPLSLLDVKKSYGSEGQGSEGLVRTDLLSNLWAAMILANSLPDRGSRECVNPACVIVCTRES